MFCFIALFYHSKCEADQHLYFRNMDSTILLSNVSQSIFFLLKFVFHTLQGFITGPMDSELA